MLVHPDWYCPLRAEWCWGFTFQWHHSTRPMIFFVFLEKLLRSTTISNIFYKAFVFDSLRALFCLIILAKGEAFIFTMPQKKIFLIFSSKPNHPPLKMSNAEHKKFFNTNPLPIGDTSKMLYFLISKDIECFHQAGANYKNLDDT